jgi:ribosome-binding protein aMBF1 (putative translation factor)
LKMSSAERQPSFIQDWSKATESARASSHQDWSKATESARASSHQDWSKATESARASSHQDWSPVIIKGRSVASAAQAKAGPKLSPEVQRLNKLAAADGPMKPKTLAAESRQQMISLRVANKWSQMDLNTRCSFPANTIREIEAGRLCPSIHQLNTLNRVLHCGLRYSF